MDMLLRLVVVRGVSVLGTPMVMVLIHCSIIHSVCGSFILATYILLTITIALFGCCHHQESCQLSPETVGANMEMGMEHLLVLTFLLVYQAMHMGIFTWLTVGITSCEKLTQMDMF